MSQTPIWVVFISSTVVDMMPYLVKALQADMPFYGGLPNGFMLGERNAPSNPSLPRLVA